jgi:hypothetical protein
MLNIICTMLACTGVRPRESTIDGSQFIRKYSTDPQRDGRARAAVAEERAHDVVLCLARRMLARRDEVRRLLQEEREQRQGQERPDAADIEDMPPAFIARAENADHRRERRAERHAAVHRADRRAALFRRRRFRAQRDQVRHRRTKTETREESHDKQASQIPHLGCRN